jgi:hypothetical protein
MFLAKIYFKLTFLQAFFEEFTDQFLNFIEFFDFIRELALD